ncbi:MAG TPA: YndJ family transporter [Frankiaceae bacterium]|nr:YndJ family transporter [Frankiaceae bacterium]
MPGLVGVLSVLGMVVVAPLGLLLLATPGVRRYAPIWPFPALMAGWGLLQPRGENVAVAMVMPYAIACATIAVLAAVRALRALLARRITTNEMAAAFAGLSLTVAATSLVAERAGKEALGFPLAIHGLTVAHFHFAAFAAVIVAALTAQAAPASRVASVAAWAVPLGTAVTFVGFFTGEYVELAGASILTAGLLATSHVLFRLRPNVLLLVASLALPLTMALAMWWAAGEALGFAHPTLEEMARTHGLANALGVGLCGLAGWHLARAKPL